MPVPPFWTRIALAMSVSTDLWIVPTAIRTPPRSGRPGRRLPGRRTASSRRPRGRGVAPGAPSSPSCPGAPCGPCSPVSPLRPEKAKANVRAPGVPPSVTVTDGAPVEASTLHLGGRHRVLPRGQHRDASRGGLRPLVARRRPREPGHIDPQVLRLLREPQGPQDEGRRAAPPHARLRLRRPRHAQGGAEGPH